MYIFALLLPIFSKSNHSDVDGRGEGEGWVVMWRLLLRMGRSIITLSFVVECYNNRASFVIEMLFAKVISMTYPVSYVHYTRPETKTKFRAYIVRSCVQLP